MNSLSTLETLDYFGFKENPFKKIALKTAEETRLQRIIKMAVQGHEVVSVVGERGCGKSRTVNEVLRKMLRIQRIFVKSADKSRLLISDIEQAIILNLSDEKPKRGREIRAYQLCRIIGEASRKYEPVLVIEESHMLHGMTLKALKSLREMEWMGDAELFTVILIGQSDPLNKAGMSELRLRTNTVWMEGLSDAEILEYIKRTVGGVFNAKAQEYISNMSDAKNYLGLQKILITLMAEALFAGAEMVSRELVEEIYGSLPGAASADPDGNDAIRDVLGQDDGTAADKKFKVA